MLIKHIIHVEDNPRVAQSVEAMIMLSDKFSDSHLIQVGTLQEALSLLDGGTISDSPDTCFVLDGNFPSRIGESPVFNGPILVKAIRERMKAVLIIGFATSAMDAGNIPELNGSAQKPDVQSLISILNELNS